MLVLRKKRLTLYFRYHSHVVWSIAELQEEGWDDSISEIDCYSFLFILALSIARCQCSNDKSSSDALADGLKSIFSVPYPTVRSDPARSS